MNFIINHVIYVNNPYNYSYKSLYSRSEKIAPKIWSYTLSFLFCVKCHFDQPHFSYFGGKKNKGVVGLISMRYTIRE